MRRIFLLFLLLTAFAIRLWMLDGKGLSYDEAATALMARATPSEIIAFHWRAAFEHPPLWQLLMHFWSSWVGQSEFALRLPAVLAGVVTLPLLWALARRLGVAARTAMIATLLATVAPVLVYYSQEARMYALVVALALASLVVTQQLAVAPTRGRVVSYLLLNWMMLGLHYYSALLIVAEGAFWLGLLIAQRQPRRYWVWHGLALTLAALPLVAWMLWAPGFRDTATIVLRSVGDAQPSLLAFLDALWRDLSFAALRWQPATAVWGYLLLPFVGLGFVVLLAANKERQQAGLFLLLVCLMPIGITLLLSRTLATRYLLYVMPPLLLVSAVGITWLRRLHRGVASAALLIALTPAALSLPHYFGPYQKSAYREMVAYLTAHRQPDEAILLEGPRQHLLTKYYLPEGATFLTAPVIDLPSFWPVNAPPVVPEAMDDYLLKSLHEYQGLWLSLTAEDEVDDGEFVPKFLTAVAFQRDCHAWLDVRLCHFVSPHFVQPQVQTPLTVLFGEALLLQEATVALLAPRADEPAYLLTTLIWLAQTKPSIDYRVTLRLLDGAGTIVSQRDDFPIGPLLPPSTWNAGDIKPGYLALPIPRKLPAGDYQLAVALYEPATLALVAHRAGSDAPSSAIIPLAAVTIDAAIRLNGVTVTPAGQ